jgi:arabinose-5-phosphate isomerase
MSLNALEQAKKTIAIEIEALQAMSNRLDKEFQRAIDTILSTRGRVVVIGMGKSGLIGQKIVATLASTGTPSFFVHPGEAFHGDLGMIKPIDVALLISNSGETEEVIRLLPFLQYQKNKLIAMTGNDKSTLARNADIVLNIAVEREACTNNLAPTSSTTATLVMGDALAVALTQARNFQPEDFARFHPGGALGRKLLLRVLDVMKKDNIPKCNPESSFKDLIHSINRGKIGLTLIEERGKLVGIITDGDIRRAFDKFDDLSKIKAQSIMTKNPKTISAESRYSEAEGVMKNFKINSLVVMDGDLITGVVQIYE